MLVLALPLAAESGLPPLHLREGEVPVENQSAAARSAALGEALAQVLVRMSGDSAVANDPLVRRQLEQAPRLLQHFRYRQEVEAPPGVPPRLQLYLVARFDADGVDRLLDAAGIRLWLARRPTTLLLVELDGEEGRVLLGEADAARLEPFHRRARLRALPTVLPLLDLEEQIRLTPQALGAGLRDLLEDMGRRYGAPAVLHGQLTQVADFWVARWTLSLPGGSERWESVGALESVLAAGADGLGDALGRRYALSAAERLGGSYRIAVAGLVAATDYPRLVRYLAENPLVRDLAVELAEGDRVHLRVQAGASLERLVESLTLGYTLAADPAPGRQSADSYLLLLP
jgi:hypothetical protein